MNIGFGPNPPKLAVCPKHNVPYEDFDDVVKKCTEEGCNQITLRNDLHAIPCWWHTCDKCYRTYPTLESGICTICDETMQQRWDQIIAELGR